MTNDQFDQLVLFDTPPAFTPHLRGVTIDEAFTAFHAANPWVYTALVRLARSLHDRGHNRVGIGMLFEVLRWNWSLHTIDPTSDYKLNNNLRSRYARLIAEQEADLADVFELRKLTAA